MKGTRNWKPSRPAPKPKDVKKRKKANGWKDKNKRYCIYCRTAGAERHEVFGGPNRQISIDLGFQIDLCRDCHRAWHDQKEDIWIRRKAMWQETLQQTYEDKLVRNGMAEESARRHWMAIIGKNYRSDDCEEKRADTGTDIDG